MCRRLTRTGSRYLNLWSLTASSTLVSCLCLHITLFSHPQNNIPLLQVALLGEVAGKTEVRNVSQLRFSFSQLLSLFILHIRSPALLRPRSLLSPTIPQNQKSLDSSFFSCHVPSRVSQQPSAPIIPLHYPQLQQSCWVWCRYWLEYKYHVPLKTHCKMHPHRTKVIRIHNETLKKSLKGIIWFLSNFMDKGLVQPWHAL